MTSFPKGSTADVRPGRRQPEQSTRYEVLVSFLRRYPYLLPILVAGLALRVWQIGWGLPELYEEATPLAMARGFWNWGRPGFDFNPHFFNYPALTFYLQFLGQAIHYACVAPFGLYRSLGDFLASVTPLAVGGRLISVLLDAGIIWGVYLLAARYADRRAAIFAALVVAVSPIDIQLAHMIQVDTALAFFCLVSLLLFHRIATDARRRWYILAGVSIGLAAASKYTGALLIPVLVAVHLLRSKTWAAALRSLRDPSLLLGIAASIAVFFVVNPYIILSSSEFYRDFSFEEHHVSYGHLGIDPGTSTLAYYFLNVLPSCLGWPLAIAILLGLVVLFRRRDESLVVLLFPAIYLFTISTWTMRAERYLFPLIPPLIAVGAVGLVRLWDLAVERAGKVSAAARNRARTVIGAIVVALLIVFPLLSSADYLHSLGLPDTRAIAKEWIMEHLKPGAAIATGPYGVDFPDSTYPMLHIPFIAFETERALPFYDTRWYEDMDLLIASDFDYGRFAAEPERYAGFLPYYDSLGQRWTKVADFTPDGKRTGPAIWLYKYPDSLRTVLFDSTLFDRLSGQPESSRVSGFLKSLEALLYRKGKLEKCRQILENIMAVEVGNLSVRNHLAQVLYDLGQYDACLRQLQMSVSQDAAQPQVFALAGSALRRINRPREAEAVLQKALALDRTLDVPYLELRELYAGEDDRAKLIGILSQYLSVLPGGSSRAREITQQLDSLKRMR